MKKLNKLVILYVLFALLIPGTFALTYILPIKYLSFVSFPSFHHKIIETIVILISILIFYRANKLYTETRDRRMAVIAAGFLAGILLNIFHIASSKVFPYDVLKTANIYKNPDLLYLLFGNWIYAITLFIPIFYTFQPVKEQDINFRKKIFIIFIISALLIILSDKILDPYIFSVSPFFTDKIMSLYNTLKIVNDAFFILAVFIYADMRIFCNFKILSKFVTGLIILEFGQLVFLNQPGHYIPLYGISAHLIKIIGFIFIFIGLTDIQIKNLCISIRQKLAAYFSLFLIFSYLIFVSLSAIAFNIKFSSYSSFIFLEFFIITNILQYMMSLEFVIPIANIIKGIERFIPGKAPVAIPVVSNDEIGLLSNEINMLAELNWKYTQELLSRHENEKLLRDIILEIRKLKNPDEIYNYLIINLISLFNVRRSLYLNFDEHHNLFVKNEYIVKSEYKSLLNEPVLEAKFTKELIPAPSQIIIVNDVNTEIYEESLKIYLLNNQIQAFLLYPISKPIFEKAPEEILGIMMITSLCPRSWSLNEIELFKLVNDAVSVVYLEMVQRLEVEKIRDNFIATLTHDLKSPIFAEQKAIEFMLSKKPETQLKEFSEYLEDIYKTNEELLRIVNNLLAVYHYESGSLKLTILKTSLNEIIDETLRSLKHLVKDNNSEIITNIQENLPEVKIDKLEINRVLTNLITNAIKHNSKGVKITISAQKTDNEVQVAVSDNGQGITEAEKSRIFQRYPSVKREVGTGLGLYLSKQIIEAHNGRIWFETELGKGTTFYFTVPAA